MHAAEKGTLPSDSKKVSVTLDETKKAVIGFSSVDAASVGVFGDMSPYLLNDGIDLEIQSDGTASTPVGGEDEENKYYVFYQIASDEKLGIFIYADGALKGERKTNGSDYEINFIVEVSGDEKINTEKGTGVGSVTNENLDIFTHTPTGENGRYAWADGRELVIRTDESVNFYNLKADRFIATLTVEVRTVS